MSGRFLGGTDLAAICALYKPEFADSWAKWATASDVWMRIIHDIERKRTAAMGRGLSAEPKLRKAWLDAYGGSFMPRPEKWIVNHSRLPFVGCSPDDVWLNGDTGSYVDWKTTSIFARSAWGDKTRADSDDFDGDGAPESYAMQVQLNLDILNLDTGYLFVGFGRDSKDESGEPVFMYEETRRYRFDRDRELIAFALQYAERFWREHIETRIPPSVDPKHNIRAWKRILKGQLPWKVETEAQSSTEAL